PGEMARVVLDALAVADLLQHLEVETGALLEPLCLDKLAHADQLVEPAAQFLLDRLDRRDDAPARRRVVAGRVDDEARDLLPDPAGERVEQGQRLEFVVEKL